MAMKANLPLNEEYREERKKDLKFHTPGGLFNYRAGAIIIHNGKYLLMHNSQDPYYYSVGGRVRFDETTEEAAVREVLEETGVLLEIDRILFFQEQFFESEVTGDHIHELGVYYLMKDSDARAHVECHSVTGLGAVEELIWVTPEELKEIRFVPESVGKRLLNLPEQMEHIIEINKR